jgi:raffinose/stachyose/melibiose transport system substrate-binding protein
MKKLFLSLFTLCIFFVSFTANAKTTLVVACPAIDTKTKICEELGNTYTALNPDIEFEYSPWPATDEGRTVLGTQLATGTAADIIHYNAGALLGAVNPAKTLVPLTGHDLFDNIDPGYLPAVTVNNEVYGIPGDYAMGSGFFYNKKVYAKYGLNVPMTWSEFISNCEKIKSGGEVCVHQTFGTDWTSQIVHLGSHCLIENSIPGWYKDYGNNKAKWSTTSVGMRGWEKQQELFDRGFINEDHAASTLEEGFQAVATGSSAHYAMLTFATGNFQSDYPDQLNDIGFFAIPGDDISKACMTTWMPDAFYITSSSDHIEEAKKFLSWASTTDGCAAIRRANPSGGILLNKGCPSPEDAVPALKDASAYISKYGSFPALEFVVSVKGPALPRILVEVGSGMISAAEGAAKYDVDVKKQAQQMGLEGWD